MERRNGEFRNKEQSSRVLRVSVLMMCAAAGTAVIALTRLLKVLQLIGNWPPGMGIERMECEEAE